MFRALSHPGAYPHRSGACIVARTYAAAVMDELEETRDDTPNRLLLGQDFRRNIFAECNPQSKSPRRLNSPVGGFPGDLNHHNDFGVCLSVKSSNNNGWLWRTVIPPPRNIFIISSSGSRPTCGTSVGSPIRIGPSSTPRRSRCLPVVGLARPHSRLPLIPA